MELAWTVLKSVYDHRLGKEIDVGDHVKFGRVTFRVRETSTSKQRKASHEDNSQDILESDHSIQDAGTDFGGMQSFNNNMNL